MFGHVKLLQINFLPTSKISPIHKMLSFYNNLGGVDCILMWTLFLLRPSNRNFMSFLSRRQQSQSSYILFIFSSSVTSVITSMQLEEGGGHFWLSTYLCSPSFTNQLLNPDSWTGSLVWTFDVWRVGPVWVILLSAITITSVCCVSSDSSQIKRNLAQSI